MVAAVRRFWRLSRSLTAPWLVMSLAGPLIPVVLALVSGRIVGAVPGVVKGGFGSPAGHQMRQALVV
ncbi:MAG: hypothetical protein ACREOQ_13865, partial [Gemmatimonadales bacterium]